MREDEDAVASLFLRAVLTTHSIPALHWGFSSRAVVCEHMKATDVIRRDHRAIESLFAELEASDPDNNKELEDRMFAALEAHEKMEDEHFYPAIKAELLGDEMFEELEREQKILEAETIAAKMLPIGRTAALKLAMPKVLEHAKKEEASVLTRADEFLTEEQNESIGDLMEPMSVVAITS